MNINRTMPSKNKVVDFLVTPIKDSEDTSTAVDVPWGYYIASQGQRILTRAMTTSLASCFAYIFWDKGRNNFLFAHVSTNGEACSVVNLVTELSGGNYSGQEIFVCVAGRTPTDSTYERINHVVKNLGQPHRFFKTDTGGVTVDISAETVVKTKGPKAQNVAISDNEKSAAMNKQPNLPLYPIQVPSAWVGSGNGNCPKLVISKARNRADSF